MKASDVPVGASPVGAVGEFGHAAGSPPTGTQVLSAAPTGTQVLSAAPSGAQVHSAAATGTQVLPSAAGREAPGTQPPVSGTLIFGSPGGDAPTDPARPRTEVLRGSPAPSAAPAPHLEPAAGGPRAGDRVKQYELIRPLGRGGMGEVFLARDTKLGRRVAVKFLHTEDPALVERFLLEARATARFNHENIVTLYEADLHEGRPYMVLEYLRGKDLATLVGDGGALPPGRVVELMAPVLRALACAHAEGIVHRDLKFENIVLTDAGVVKVLDFGIAKVLEGEPPRAVGAGTPAVAEPRPDLAAGASASSLTQHGTTLGTLQYMSPEQWAGGELDHRSDLWAVGVMLFRMLSGRHPLAGLEGMQLAVVADLSQPMASLRGAAPDVPAKLAEAVDACLEKDRERRPPDALSLLRAIEPFLPGRGGRELGVDESPYTGLSAFQESDADRFFGRTNEVAALVSRLRDRPAMAVVGPSGVGKSSFVRAGVAPALKREGERWETLVLRPGRSPLAALARSFASLGAVTSSGAGTDELGQERDLLGRLTVEPGYAGAALRAHARRHGARVLLFLDQFEELYTLVPDRAERLAFTACLAGIADDAASPVRVVLSIRSDFLDRVAEDPRFMAELSQGLFFLGTPGEEGLRDALTRPAEMAGFRFESAALVDELVRDVRQTEGALSLLQFAAAQLWEARDTARRVLTRASYEAIGGISGALARYADRVLAELPANERTAARELFMRLVSAERTRAIVSVDELVDVGSGGGAERLLERLAAARLVVLQQSDRGSTAEIVHESLIHAWPTLRRWLEERGEDADLIDQIRASAKQWDAGGRRADLLWRGELAEEARRFRSRFGGHLAEVQHAFLEAVVAYQTRAARRKRALTMGAMFGLLLVVAASLVAVVVIRRAQKESQRQEEIARIAEGAARQRAEELQVKERERAEAARRAEAASAELATANAGLTDALATAEAQRARALEAQKHAEQSSEEAARAQRAADRAAKQLAARLAEEQERVRRLKDQFGSPMAETLPR
jgi:eukaryotic-like serine/threonine-protein kinase